MSATQQLKHSLPAPTDEEALANKPTLSFRSGGADINLPLDQLLHVSANGEYVNYHCKDRRYTRFQRMKEAEAELAPLGFTRIHRSHIVAKEAVRAKSPTYIELIDGTQLPVSRSYRKALG
ncbi:MAG: LytTR family DNA-binding domain-containing protein [Bacteroidota bacterium]